jgi:hypothetical protein
MADEDIRVSGRHAYDGASISPRLYASCIVREDELAVRVDDKANDDFWIEVRIPIDLLFEKLLTADQFRGRSSRFVDALKLVAEAFKPVDTNEED